jgi:hypothetical protein
MNRFELSIATTRKGDSKKAVAELKGVCTLRRHVYNKFTILSTAKVLVISDQLDSAPTRNEKAIKPKQRL